MAINISAQAQVSSQTKELGIEIAKNQRLNSNNKVPVDEKDIAGTQYLDRNFHESYILKVNGVEIKDMLLRYNTYSDNMEFVKDGKAYLVAFPSEIHRIKLEGKTFIYEQYQLPNKIKYGYFQVLHEGDYQLLKKYKTTLKVPEKFATDDSMRFIQHPPVYYFRRGDGKIHPISSQKQLIKLLQPVHQPVIDFIKTNKINASDELKLLRFMDFLEENGK